MGAADILLVKLERVILFPLMTFLLSVALLVFFWGAYQFVANADNDGARETGRRHMIFGIIGMLIMISAYSILRIATNTFEITMPG